MTRTDESRLLQWTAHPLDADVKAALHRLLQSDDVRRVAVMPDVHLSEDVCVGCVVATQRHVYPDAVGGDIGCGMAAMAFDGSAELLACPQRAGRVLRALAAAVPVMRHHTPPPPEEDPDRLSDPHLRKLARRDGQVQFGTLGRGNHFVELQADDSDRLWLMVHSGSRAMGQAIRACHRAAADMDEAGLLRLDAQQPTGQAYLSDVAWALDYARASRAHILSAVAQVLHQECGVAPLPSSRIDCHHNYVRRERHLGMDLWVHRKGAIAADEGVAGIIPGSMGSSSYHVTGRGHEPALRSSSHGAGRAMSRTDARKRIRLKDLNRQMTGVWFDQRLAAKLLDEAPGAYKDITAVMRAQTDLTRITRRLKPLLCYKGG